MTKRSKNSIEELADEIMHPTEPKFHQSVEQDMVRSDELAKVVERAINKGWTIIAITPRILTTGGVVSNVVEYYLIIRSKVL